MPPPWGFLEQNCGRDRVNIKGSSQKFAHRGQTKELSYGTLPPPSLLKRKCDRQWEKCMADGFAHYPRSSPQPAQTMPSVSRTQGRFPEGSASIVK